MTAAQRDLLHALGYLYLRCGQNRRALTMLLLAARAAPDDPGLLKSLAFAFLANGDGAAAQAAIEALEPLLPAGRPRAMTLLLRSRALLLQGDAPAARACFRRFVEQRAAAPLPAPVLP